MSDSIYEDLDYKKEEYKINPSLPFLFTDYWNLNPEDFENVETFENEYFDPKYTNGLIRLCNYGCGVFINLVVNGEDYGKMWTDDRGSDGGIYPSIELENQEKLGFLKWYEFWLDNSLEKLKNL